MLILPVAGRGLLETTFLSHNRDTMSCARLFCRMFMTRSGRRAHPLKRQPLFVYNRQLRVEIHEFIELFHIFKVEWTINCFLKKYKWYISVSLSAVYLHTPYSGVDSNGPLASVNPRHCSASLPIASAFRFVF